MSKPAPTARLWPRFKPMADCHASSARWWVWDREAAKKAFSEFFQSRKLTADQHEFLDLIIEHLTARGTMDPRLLYEAPFTDFDSKGVEGVFEHPDVLRLVKILRDVEPRNAA